MLGNPIGFLAFSVVLYRFFSHRIGSASAPFFAEMSGPVLIDQQSIVEEQLLIKFFADTYVQYRQKVPTRILFIR